MVLSNQKASSLLEGMTDWTRATDPHPNSFPDDCSDRVRLRIQIIRWGGDSGLCFCWCRHAIKQEWPSYSTNKGDSGAASHDAYFSSPVATHGYSASNNNIIYIYNIIIIIISTNNIARGRDGHKTVVRQKNQLNCFVRQKDCCRPSKKPGLPSFSFRTL
jgi:hypothetical protein